MKKWIINSVLVLFLAACGSDALVPKPTIYPRIVFPEKSYKVLENQAPFTFEIPVYANVSLDKAYAMQNYWYNINYTPFNATLHLSYYPINRQSDLDSLKEDTRKLAYKHAFRADEISNVEFSKSQEQVYGNMFLIDGNTATNLNFYLTDSLHNFVRGALYFNAKTKNDSIYPVFQFLKQDIEHMVSTFKWTK